MAYSSTASRKTGALGTPRHDHKACQLDRVACAPSRGLSRPRVSSIRSRSLSVDLIGATLASAAARSAVPVSHARSPKPGLLRRSAQPRASWAPGRLLRYAAVVAAVAGAAWLSARRLAPVPAPADRGASLAARAAACAAAPTATPTEAATPVQISVVAELDSESPFGAHWGEVLRHMGQRLAWTDPSYRLAIHDAGEVEGSADAMQRLAGDILGSDITLLLGIHDSYVVSGLADLLKGEPTVVALGSSPDLGVVTRLGGRPLQQSPAGGLPALLAALLPGGKEAQEDAQVHATVQELFERNSSDDLLFVFLVLINQYVREVPLVANSTKSTKAGLPELKCMIQKCGPVIFQCYADTNCRTALNCLNSCQFNDQVCSYRCIVSYESPLLAEFSLCVLQKHNCLGLSADIPMVPDPAPLASFNGQPMTHELAEDLFIGWLEEPSSKLAVQAADKQRFSWRVFGGKNAAYDKFPCQFQLFYRGKAQRSMWYDPVFKVKTLDGGEVWRRRHYRMRRGPNPGSFYLSVLDNGVTSSEFWRILDCAEDLEWCAFYYGGAAAAAGTSYTGAILTTKSGQWPQSQAALTRIEQALDRAGIKMWELTSVDNSACQDAPLDPSLMAMG